jgi:hypothetical protein
MLCEPTVAQLVKKLLVFYKIRKFVTAVNSNSIKCNQFNIKI